MRLHDAQICRCYRLTLVVGNKSYIEIRWCWSDRFACSSWLVRIITSCVCNRMCCNTGPLIFSIMVPAKLVGTMLRIKQYGTCIWMCSKTCYRLMLTSGVVVNEGTTYIHPLPALQDGQHPWITKYHSNHAIRGIYIYIYINILVTILAWYALSLRILL